MSRSDRSLFTLFAASGFAALVYQVVWQRSLFAIYGINIEAVTVVVTAFMLGLGIGSLAGGALSRNPHRPALRTFAGIEIAIGVFGFFSLALLHTVGEATLRLPMMGTACVTFLLVLVPTLLMGATLPLLVAHRVRRSGNVGMSVGALYCINTLGSALACFATVLWMMPALGQSGSVVLAGVLNVSVGLGALLLQRAEVAS
ncbi:MAG: fused MFS/spermidine synthase [Planctomycetes bacterium]|nr:fused MFS/spermidine synthase [Planctomycetota bacterium]